MNWIEMRISTNTTPEGTNMEITQTSNMGPNNNMGLNKYMVLNKYTVIVDMVADNGYGDRRGYNSYSETTVVAETVVVENDNSSSSSSSDVGSLFYYNIRESLIAEIGGRA